MKIFYALLLGICISQNAFAQPETAEFPNWTHTDINGVEHTLYDYLDDGKIVIIDIFTTWCPNCVNSLPTLHEIWANHGPDGDNTVMMFSFERDASTTNEASWAEQHGVESPIFDDALSTMETWNTFYQPNFFVICADKSHNLIVGSLASNSNSESLNEHMDNCSVANNIAEQLITGLNLKSNLVSESIRFEITGDYAQWQIVNLSGQIVKSGVSTGIVECPTGALENGLYLLQLVTAQSMLTRKFVKG